MKRAFSVTLLVILAFGAAGCAHFGRQAASTQYRPRAFALAVTVNRVLQPTPQQWAAIQERVAAELALHGWVLVTDLALADNILRVDFTPNPNDPENSGHAQVLGIRPNPRLAIASTSSVGRYPTSFSYLGTFQNASWGYGSFSNNPYYGWGSSYYDGYSYGSANLNPTDAPLAPPTRPTHPPHRHNPGSDDDCPPPSDHYLRPRPGGSPDGFAFHHRGDNPVRPPSGDGWRGRGDDASQPHPSSSYTRSERAPTRSESSTGRSDDSGSRPERTYSRAEPSPSRLERMRSRGDSSDSTRAERTYSRSDPPESRSDRTYTRSESSGWWRNRADGSGSNSESSGSRPERSYSRSDWSGSRSERSHSRSDSSESRPERSYSRSESSHSGSERSYSRSEHSHSRSESPASPPSTSSSESSSSGGTSSSAESTAATP